MTKKVRLLKVHIELNIGASAKQLAGDIFIYPMTMQLPKINREVLIWNIQCKTKIQVEAA